MGIRASLTQIPPEIPVVLRKKGEYEPSDEVLGTNHDWGSFQKAHLDKAWWDFWTVLLNSGPPLQYAIEGDYSYPGGLAGWDYKVRDYYIGFVSAKVAQEISLKLSGFSDAEILSMFEQAGVEYDNYNSSYFQSLVSFYHKVAEEHDAVMIVIA